MEQRVPSALPAALLVLLLLILGAVATTSAKTNAKDGRSHREHASAKKKTQHTEPLPAAAAAAQNSHRKKGHLQSNQHNSSKQRPHKKAAKKQPGLEEEPRRSAAAAIDSLAVAQAAVGRLVSKIGACEHPATWCSRLSPDVQKSINDNRNTIERGVEAWAKSGDSVNMQELEQTLHHLIGLLPVEERQDMPGTLLAVTAQQKRTRSSL